MGIRLGPFDAVACRGARHAKHKDFMGIADIADRDYCPMQACLSQWATEDGYRKAAQLDDKTAGHSPVRTRRAFTPEELKEAEWWLKEEMFGNPDWMIRGRLAELNEPSLLNTVSSRRHFDCGPFYLIGVPDGLTLDTVIEFACSSWVNQMVNRKKIQANIYAVLWERPQYRIVVQDPRTGFRVDKTYPTDAEEAGKHVLAAWSESIGDHKPLHVYPSPKCRPCRYQTPCEQMRELEWPGDRLWKKREARRASQ